MCFNLSYPCLISWQHSCPIPEAGRNIACAETKINIAVTQPPVNYDSPVLAVGFCDPLNWYLGVSRSGSLMHSWILWVWAFSLFLALRLASSMGKIIPDTFPSDRRGCRGGIASRRVGIQGLFRLCHPSIPYPDLLNLLPLNASQTYQKTAALLSIAESSSTLRSC